MRSRKNSMSKLRTKSRLGGTSGGLVASPRGSGSAAIDGGGRKHAREMKIKNKIPVRRRIGPSYKSDSAERWVAGWFHASFNSSFPAVSGREPINESSLWAPRQKPRGMTLLK